MATENITPIRKQYLDIKKQHPNAILFFRLGDFYETFDKDAEITSKTLDIVLTSRNVAKGQRIPMAGIPFHSAENYLGRLIEKGYHVAICEQVGEQPKRGLFSRKVTRILTPGSIIEPGLLQKDRNNYLFTFLAEGNKVGISYLDVSTGDFYSTELANVVAKDIIQAEISRLEPAEIVLPESSDINFLNSRHITKIPDWKFESNRCLTILTERFKTTSMDGFGFYKKDLALRTAGAILQYLESLDANLVAHLQRPVMYSLDEFMILDPATRRNLELTDDFQKTDTKTTLLSVIDNTVTPMGKRLIRQWIQKPLINLHEIEKRQKMVGFFIEKGLLRAEFKSHLRHITDLERIINRIITEHATPRDLLALRDTLAKLPELLQLLFTNHFPDERYLGEFNLCEDVCNLIERAISDDAPATLQNIGVIKKGFSTELDQLIANSEHAREWISNLEKVERERTGIKTLKVGYNKVFGYFIEVTHANVSLVPSDYIRKQTLVNGERYITPEMKEYEILILNSQDQIHTLESRLFKDVCKEISKSAAKLLSTSRLIAELDVLSCFAQTSENNHYCQPQLIQGNQIEIHSGRHPVVEKTIANLSFVPNDSIFDETERIRIITGPNMSGKSTYLRQVALIILLAQIGCYVPAESAKIGIVDRIFTRIGAKDEISAGQSTFMVEMVEAANILNNATAQSLIILDEIGRGTSTYDGLSIAWAIVEYIHNHPKLKARTLFATHYHELTKLATTLPGVRNFNVAVTESGNEVVFLHKIIPGGADKSYGIHVAQLAGIPLPVIQRAREILLQLESQSKGQTLLENTPKQMDLFPEINPLLSELEKLDLNSISPLDALNILFKWKEKYNK